MHRHDTRIVLKNLENTCPTLPSRQNERWSKADSHVMSAPGRLGMCQLLNALRLIRIMQRGMLQYPRRRQRLEQFVKLKRTLLASGKDRLNNVWGKQS